MARDKITFGWSFMRSRVKKKIDDSINGLSQLVNGVMQLGKYEQIRKKIFKSICMCIDRTSKRVQDLCCYMIYTRFDGCMSQDLQAKLTRRTGC